MKHDPIAPRANVPTGLPVRETIADARRLAALTDVEPSTRDALDHLAALTAFTLDAEEAYVVLIDDAGQRVVGRHGPATGWRLDQGLCPYVLALGEPLMIGDLSEDEIGATKAVDAPGTRAYAASNLRADGERVGTLCVLSHRARAWTIGDAQRLVELTDVADYLLAHRNRSPDA